LFWFLKFFRFFSRFFRFFEIFFPIPFLLVILFFFTFSRFCRFFFFELTIFPEFHMEFQNKPGGYYFLVMELLENYGMRYVFFWALFFHTWIFFSRFFWKKILNFFLTDFFLKFLGYIKATSLFLRFLPINSGELCRRS
jgi:hypothetical protein